MRCQLDTSTPRCGTHYPLPTSPTVRVSRARLAAIRLHFVPVRKLFPLSFVPTSSYLLAFSSHSLATKISKRYAARDYRSRRTLPTRPAASLTRIRVGLGQLSSIIAGPAFTRNTRIFSSVPGRAGPGRAVRASLLSAVRVSYS